MDRGTEGRVCLGKRHGALGVSPWGGRLARWRHRCAATHELPAMPALPLSSLGGGRGSRVGSGPRCVWRATGCRRLLLVLVGLVLGLAWDRRAQNTAFSEYDVKAACLLNFARFVEWPTNGWTNPRTPLVVGVAGRDPFGKGLEKAFVGKTIRGRPVVLKRGVSDAEARRCHLLFMGRSERRRLRDRLEPFRALPILTVSETDEFLDQGGVINFGLKENAVLFEINVRAAQRAGLRLDANLLKVAVSVRGRYE